MARHFLKRSADVSYRLSGYLLVITFLILMSSVPASAQPPVIKQGDNFQSPFARVYEKVAPSVVRVDIKAEVTNNPWQFFFEDNTPQQRRPVEGMGCGVIVDNEGHILTNNHVISGADKITVKVNENETYDAEVIGADPESDLAVIKLKLNSKKLPDSYVADLGDSDTLRPGDYAIAIGNPIGLERSINVGVISALGRHDFSVMGGASPRFQDFIQTDAQINPGNSGGALADINGRIIGINDMYTYQYAGIGFAIPINLAKNVMGQLIAKGKVIRGFVGIQAYPDGISKEIQDALELPSREGVLIDNIVADSPAEKAGLEHGDVIVSLDGQKVKNFQDFLFRIAAHSPGESVSLEIVNNKKHKTISLTLTDRPTFATANEENGVEWRGIHVVDMSSSVQEKFNLGAIKNGVVVVKIDENSPAGNTNLKVGDVIVEIEQMEVKNTDDFTRIKNKPELKEKTVLIYKKRVYSNGEVSQGFVAVKSK